MKKEEEEFHPEVVDLVDDDEEDKKEDVMASSGSAITNIGSSVVVASKPLQVGSVVAVEDSSGRSIVLTPVPPPDFLKGTHRSSRQGLLSILCTYIFVL